MPVPLSYFLVLSALLFGVGLTGVIVRRNILVLLMSIELMLNGANLAFIAFARARQDLGGHVVAFIVIAVAAAEAALGLAIIINVFRHFRSVNADSLTTLRD